jgi:hypothetical protein
MKVRFFGCGKFGWLSSESEDRPLTEIERSFMERHRAVCNDCVRREEAAAMALNMLRESGIEAEQPARSYDLRLIRRVRVQAVRASAQYWSPVVFGAAIATLVLVGALQLVSRSGQLPVFRAGTSEARRIRIEAPAFPDVPISERIVDTP